MKGKSCRSWVRHGEKASGEERHNSAGRGLKTAGTLPRLVVSRLLNERYAETFMKKNVSAGIILSALLGLGWTAGCVVGVPQDESSAESLEVGTVATVDVGYGTVSFHEFAQPDGTTVIAIGQLTPNTYGWTPLHDTMAHSTNLEVFLALVPEREPPESYVRAHAKQAEALGRPNADVLEAKFDRDAPVEKTSAQCKNWITPASTACFRYTYSHVIEGEDRVGTTNITLGATTSRTTLGICNDGPYAVKGRLQYAMANSNTYTQPGWTPNVPPNSGWIWFGAWVEGPCVSDGVICDLGPPLNVKWRVEGTGTTSYSSNKYDLRAARIATTTWMPNPPFGCPNGPVK